MESHRGNLDEQHPRAICVPDGIAVSVLLPPRFLITEPASKIESGKREQVGWETQLYVSF
jgi:hypothetical protein